MLNLGEQFNDGIQNLLGGFNWKLKYNSPGCTIKLSHSLAIYVENQLTTSK